MMFPMVLVLALHAEPNEAEKLFRDMEKKVNSAKTLECEFELKIEGGLVKLSVKGTLALAEGNQCHLDAKVEGDGQTQTRMLISDGKKMHGVKDGKPDQEEDTPKHLGELTRALITRIGPLLPWVHGDLGWKPGEKEFKVVEMYTVSDFKLGRKENHDQRPEISTPSL